MINQKACPGVKIYSTIVNLDFEIRQPASTTSDSPIVGVWRPLSAICLISKSSISVCYFMFSSLSLVKLIFLEFYFD